LSNFTANVSSVREKSQEFDAEHYWENRLEPFNLAAVGYHDLGIPFNRWVYRVRRHVFRRTLRALESHWEDKQVLDVGSGIGFYISEWLRTGASVTGSDLTRVSVDRLRAAFPGSQFIQWDVTQEPPLAPGNFDAVSAFDVLFHIVDDSRYASAFAHVADLLREGGYFLFSEFLLHDETVRVSHQASRPLEEIEALLRTNSLELVERRAMLVLMNPPIDSANPVLRGLWRVLGGVLTRAPALGGVIGAFLYPIELLLVSRVGESPTTEVVVCRKRTA
jgi:SAM-dependent methyltransferase